MGSSAASRRHHAHRLDTHPGEAGWLVWAPPPLLGGSRTFPQHRPAPKQPELCQCQAVCNHVSSHDHRLSPQVHRLARSTRHRRLITVSSPSRLVARRRRTHTYTRAHVHSNTRTPHLASSRLAHTYSSKYDGKQPVILYLCAWATCPPLPSSTASRPRRTDPYRPHHRRRRTEACP